MQGVGAGQQEMAMNQQMAAQMQGGMFPMGMKGSYMGGMYPASPYQQHGDQARPYKGSGKGAGMHFGSDSLREARRQSKGGGGGGCGYGGCFGAYGGYGGYCGGYSGTPNYAGAWTPGTSESETTRQIELAQRRAKFRDKSAISQAQRSAQMRFEKDLLDRVQGSWVDESDRTVSYVVEGSMCTVSGGDNARVFRNRLSLYNGELCWDARRWWHCLNIKALPLGDEPLDRVEWNVGQGSPPTNDIVWVRGEPPALVPEMMGHPTQANEGENEAEEDPFAVPPDTV
mmetsp:Transcript_42037/g.121906  ORF Transcript_42037/g.121906 Transcript_42037/m.121906 type:complete len:285 (-) Transcript_42037:73-927(-)